MFNVQSHINKILVIALKAFSFEFGTINQLTLKDLVDGLPKFKYNKDHLCLACEQGKSKKASLPPKLVPSTESKLELLHMDLCGQIRVASINGKKYILVIVDDYSRYTWVYFLRTKVEAPDMIIDFVNQVQRNLKAQILTIQTDNRTEFKNEKLQALYAKLGIVHQTSIARTPQQNGVVERQNHTLVEAAQTMLIFSKALEFLWAKTIATACFTQNRSIVHTLYNKTPYKPLDLNFGTINQLALKDLVYGLLKFKYNKDHLCLACEQGKSKKASLPPKLVPSTESKLKLLHMDLCGPMRVASINGKKYILVIVDDYSWYTWVYFLRIKDEAPYMIIDFVNQVQRNLKAQILTIRTDNGTEFKNEKLRALYAKLGIVYQTSIARTPQQNGVVERQNCTLVEATQTMLIFSKALEFLWAEAIATACFAQNRSIVHTLYNKTPYELIRGRKPNIQYFHVFGSLCYPTNDRDDLGKMKPKANIGIFIGYSETSRGFRIYNRRTIKIMEMIHAKFYELTNMASECNNLEPGMNYINFQDSSEDSQSIPSKSDLDNLFGPMYEEYYATSSQEVLDNSAANTLDYEHTSASSLIIVEEDEAPQIVSSSAEQVSTEPNSPILNENVDEFIQEDVADFDGNVFYNAPPTPVFEEAESSLTYQDPSIMYDFHQKHRSSDMWTKNHPIEQVIGDLLKPVMTRNRL
ncbi:retrovirus-related pol polyprotein from transposon TNT 1-94 [Tanacetum coccineum]